MRAFTIDDVLNRGIKDVIHEHGEIGTLLAEQHVVCVTCSVGTCRLRDVIDIHDFDEVQERALLTRVAALLCPGQALNLPARKVRSGVRHAQTGWSPIMTTLMAEHRLILRLLKLIPALLADLAPMRDEGWYQVQRVLDFIRRYADQHHHAKEEDILFGYFDQDQAILKAMRQDHETGRTLVAMTAAACARRDVLAVREYLGAYRTLLTQHIQKEDTVLFPWLDRQLTDRAIGEMYQRFQDVHRRSGDLEAVMEGLVAGMEGMHGEESPSPR